MLSTTPRHLATSALCAALLLGTAAAPALAAPPDSPRSAAEHQAPALTGLGTVLTPLTQLLNRALDADDDPLTKAEEKELADAVAEAQKEIDAAMKEAEQARKEADQARKDALAEAQKEIDAALKEVAEAKKEALAEAAAATSEATTGTTAEATAEATAGTSTVETTEETSQTTNFTSDALGALGKTLSDLLSALTSLGAQEETDTATATAADDVLKSLVNVSVATQLDRELPAA